MEDHIYATGMAYRLRSQWDRDEGLGQNHKAVKFLGQDFDRLRSQSLQSGRLFEDNLFPCSASSLGFNELGPRSSKTQGVRWMRPPVRIGARRNDLAEISCILDSECQINRWALFSNPGMEEMNT